MEWVDSRGERRLLQPLWSDGERLYCRTWRNNAEDAEHALIAVVPTSEHPSPTVISRLAHEFALKDDLDAAWAARPLELVRSGGRTLLLLETCSHATLDSSLGKPLELGVFLRLALAITYAIGRLHERGLVHKDIKPANILLDPGTEQVWLTGFGIASRLPRERQAPEPPESIAGTLAYMAPEQTGRMNRTIDSRGDLYSLGVTFYEMLTGSLPFVASDPLEWVHCHIARRAEAPHERANGIPQALSSIVMKLLAKTAEERYQTAAGVEADLRRCLSEWQSYGRIEPFPLGAHDASGRLLITEELYGRETEIATLLASFDRVVTQGAPELVLVSGYSGVGKSSVVNELHRVLVPPRGLFAGGKFDQYKRDVPYATLAQAFQILIRQILVKNEAEVEQWRRALAEALGGQGQFIVNLVPELEFIIGKQQAVPDLPPQEAQNRFKFVFRRFIGAFAKREHPLTLFLDDLQWLDTATLDLIEHLVTHAEVRYLLLVGAYRDNEVGPAHPLFRKLETIRTADVRVVEIVLAPIGLDDVGRLTASALRCDLERAQPLSKLVYEKTGGNPFFAIQFLTELAEERLLAFSPVTQTWRWELDRINAKGYTDNVVDFMVEKLKRLSPRAQEAMKLLACLGHVTEITTLALGHEETEEAMHATLREAVYARLIDQPDGAYRFLHDRIQQAAYSLIPDEHRGAIHLQIGRALLANMTTAQLTNHLFDVVNQLNRGAGLIISRDEREELAALNLLAAKRARAATAYASALNYLNAGAELLTTDSWEHRHELFFALELNRAECEFLIGAPSAAEQHLTMLSSRAVTLAEQSSVACLQVDLYTTLDQTDRAIEVCLEYLRNLGIDWVPHPSQEDAQLEYERVWSQLESREVEALAELPLMSDPAALATLDVLTKALAPAMFTDANLLALIICRMVNLSIAKGSSDSSYFGYVWFGWVAVAMFGNYKNGFRFGRLGYELVDRRSVKRLQPATYHCFAAFIVPWNRHVRACVDLERQALEAANRVGDLTYAAYSSRGLNRVLLATGDPLAEVQRQTETSLAFVQSAGFGLVADVIRAQLAFVLSVRGLTSKFGWFDYDGFNEARFEQHLASDPRLAPAEYSYLIRKLQARFFAGEYTSAIAASRRAEPMLSVLGLTLDLADYHFYGALSLAATCDAVSAERHPEHVDVLRAHLGQLKVWAENCPENFENRAVLVDAEIARIENRELEAERLYEQAIHSAHANGFVHNEAVANECAGRFYVARGFERIANGYFREARDCFLRWGADGKVRQLDGLYPNLAASEEKRSVDAMGSAIQHLDVASVVKASQALSSEIELPKLIERLMKIAIENAGADRGLLILPSGDEYLIQAEARAASDQIEVTMRQESITGINCPESLVRYVIRTRESVILDDASKPNLFSNDDYLRYRQSKSILCLPLIKQQQLTGILLLENTLASHTFTPTRIAVLELLAAQAAISLENTHLYSNLQEREAKVRRLVDSNIIGILIGNPDGHAQEANREFLRIVGYDQADLAAGRLRRMELTAAEWHARDVQAVAEMKTTGTAQPYEKEYIRKDGSRVPVLVGGATLDERGDTVVIFAVDLTERKRAEADMYESERRFHEVQMELAHANRLATMGQLTASIAHEVNQPIAAALTNAGTAVRWLAGRPPDLEKAKRAINRIISDTTRAADIVAGIRSLVKSEPSRTEGLAINEAILEVITLTHGETSKNRVSVRTQLANDLPLIQGDRVQLRQVILNLIVNAVEAMSQAGDGPRDMLISTERQSAGVRIAVQDSGPGLPQAGSEQVFKAFYTTKPTGLGMGLSICRSIVEAHGGRLSAAPNEPRGAIFCFTLPAEEIDPTTLRPALATRD